MAYGMSLGHLPQEILQVYGVIPSRAIQKTCPSLVSWLHLAEDNLDEDLELLRELALESVAEEAYLDELTQNEGRSCLPEPDKESWYKEA
jgi:hypothetical protein